jgi:hypothetical protein
MPREVDRNVVIGDARHEAEYGRGQDSGSQVLARLKSLWLRLGM